MSTRALLVMLCGAAIALSGCGAKEAAVVKGAFEQDIKSANIEMTMSVKSGQEAVNVSLAGPYQSNGDKKLPSADLALKVEGAAPKTIEGRLISTGDNAFVEYEGETYEVGKDKIAELQKQGAAGGTNQLSAADIRQLMGTMQDWFPQSDTQENADLDGEPVTRVTGKLDLSKALTDLKALAAKPGMSGAEPLKQLSGGDIKRIERTVSDPKFTIDVGKSDGKLRRIQASIKVDDKSDSGTLDFSLRFKDVDKPVTINAPSSGKPIEELGQKLQDEFTRTSSSSAQVS
ncbi:MAG TPA: hypothetical protein VI300_29845 [Solirubrobacter sp.]